MPAASTTVPDAVTALLAVCTAALAGTGVEVIDGAPNADTPPDEFLSVGFSRDDEDAPVEGTTTDEGNYSSSEQYRIRCLLSTARGDTAAGAVAQARARCAHLHGLVAAAIRINPTLGGALTNGGRADVGGWSWLYGPTVDGVVAEVEFDVIVNAYYLGMT